MSYAGFGGRLRHARHVPLHGGHGGHGGGHHSGGHSGGHHGGFRGGRSGLWGGGSGWYGGPWYGGGDTYIETFDPCEPWKTELAVASADMKRAGMVKDLSGYARAQKRRNTALEALATSGCV